MILKFYLLIYEDLEDNKYDTFKKIVNFINSLKKDKSSINEKKILLILLILQIFQI